MTFFTSPHPSGPGHRATDLGDPIVMGDPTTEPCQLVLTLEWNRHAVWISSQSPIKPLSGRLTDWELWGNRGIQSTGIYPPVWVSSQGWVYVPDFNTRPTPLCSLRNHSLLCQAITARREAMGGPDSTLLGPNVPPFTVRVYRLPYHSPNPFTASTEEMMEAHQNPAADPLSLMMRALQQAADEEAAAAAGKCQHCGK
ncbi:hypothetical protein VZT92_026545 [Zoarces viviparus]|uniref:Uncharacterized protein n=1 Tax=Zoarces viviparus TaxID=48416 RepID=A0AAW1E2R2_ZOAVI